MIHVNAEEMEWEAGITIQDVLDRRKYTFPLIVVKVNGEFWTGEGMAREFVRYGLDYNGTTGTAISSRGGFVSMGVKAAPKTSFNFGYGFDDPDDADVQFDNPDTPQNEGSPFLKNQVIFGNVKQSLSKNFGIGLEIMHFATDQLDSTELSAQRVTTSYWFIF